MSITRAYARRLISVDENDLPLWDAFRSNELGVSSNDCYYYSEHQGNTKQNMDPSQYVTPHSPSQIPASRVKYHHPYFSPAEVEYLSEKQRGKLSNQNQEKLKQQACSFIEAVGTKIGL